MTVKRSNGVHLDWKALGKFTTMGEVLDLIPPEELIKRHGKEGVVKFIGVEVVIEALGIDAVIRLLGPDAALEVIGVDRILASSAVRKHFPAWESRLTREELLEMIRKKEQDEAR